MLNRYPAWKNALILLVVLLGFLYSVPNIYPDDEAIQVSADGVTLSDSDMANITTALEAAQVEFFGEEISEENILIRVNSVEDQLIAKTAIENAYLHPTSSGKRGRVNVQLAVQLGAPGKKKPWNHKR